MSLTIEVQGANRPQGGGLEVDFRVTFDDSYPTGGEVFDISSYFASIRSIQITPKSSGYVVQHDHGTPAAGVLVAYVEEAVAAGGPLVEVADEDNLSALICDIRVTGIAA